METKELIYLDFLVNLKSTLELTSYVSITKIAEKNDIHSNVTVALQQGGIIKNIGKHGRGAKWIWASKVSPNIAMASELINRVQKVKDSYKGIEPKEDVIVQQKKVVKKRAPKDKSRSTENINKKKISILWGLIKIEKG
jgi:hypothetical protein